MLRERIDRAVQFACHLLREQSTSIPRRIPHVKDHVSYGVVVKGVKIFRQLQMPRADRPLPFKRQVALDAHASVKHAAVILRATRGDGLYRPETVGKAFVL